MKEVCDLARYTREEGAAVAKIWCRRSPTLYLDFARLLHALCSGDQFDLAAVSRVIDVIVTLTPPTTLLVVLRPFLREGGQRLRAKIVLVLAQNERNPGWAEKLMEDDDGRIRASVIEGLWGVTPRGCSNYMRALWPTSTIASPRMQYTVSISWMPPTQSLRLSGSSEIKLLHFDAQELGWSGRSAQQTFVACSSP